MAADDFSAVSWPEVLGLLIGGSDLASDQTAWVMRQILSGDATASQIAGFAVALRSKGETVEEVEGLVATMYEFAVPLSFAPRAVDIVGTGGDRAHTVNISTMAAIVAAGAGVPIVKHGNRAASSSCGSADVLEELGIRLDLLPSQVEEVLHLVGITFCFAPVFHSALRHSAVPRRELGVPTTFNFLGPLANPARPAAQAVGVADPRMAGVLAGVLARRGVDGFVFRGDDGLDELTTTTTSRVWAIDGGEVHEQILEPLDLGLARSRTEDLRGGLADFNAQVVRDVVAGRPGPVLDAVLLNAASAIAAYDGDAGDVTAQLEAGLAKARSSVESGAASDRLSAWVDAVAGL